MTENKNIKFNDLLPGGRRESCKVWSRQGELEARDCEASLPAVCVRDMASQLVFPHPETDISISQDSETLNLRRLDTARGWRVNYSLQAWHRDNQSRRSV